MSVESLTDLARALAWPFIALLAMWRFSPELRALLGRFRRAAGVEFDPPTTQGSVPASPSLTTLPANLPPLPPSTAALVTKIRTAPDFLKLTDAQRVEQLLHFVALFAFLADAERIEGQIWASQLAVLEHLNAMGDGGDALANVKARFYDGAAARFPAMFVGYAFESYLGFLRTNELLTVDGDVARITQQGRDYLAWRVQARKPPRPAG